MKERTVLTEQSHHEQEPRPRITIREAVDGREVVTTRAFQAAAWLATYPNDTAGVSREWVQQRTDEWLKPESLEKSIGRLNLIINDPTQFYRIAEVDGKAVGFIHLTTHEDDTKEISAMYTSPETFGSGVGTKLMETALGWVGDVDTTLNVATYNERAIRFYEKHGFCEIPGSHDLYADTIPQIKMIRKGVQL